MVAETVGAPLPTVRLYARLLREAGLLNSHGRGPYSGQMTTTDAAVLLLALLGTNKAIEAVETIEMAAAMRISSQAVPSRLFGFADAGLAQASGVQVLARLLDELASGRLQEINRRLGGTDETLAARLSVAFRLRGGRPALMLSHSTGNGGSELCVLQVPDAHDVPGFEVLCRMSGRMLLAVATAFAEPG